MRLTVIAAYLALLVVGGCAASPAAATLRLESRDGLLVVTQAGSRVVAGTGFGGTLRLREGCWSVGDDLPVVFPATSTWADAGRTSVRLQDDVVVTAGRLLKDDTRYAFGSETLPVAAVDIAPGAPCVRAGQEVVLLSVDRLP